MKKRIFIAIIGIFVLIGVLGGIKGLQISRMIAHGKQFVPPPETVTTTAVQSESWEAALAAVGSLEAVQGVTVSAEMSGRVVQIAFEAGSKVKAGDLLVQQDTSSERAQLRAAEAILSLAKTDLERKQKLLETLSIAERLEAVYGLMQGELSVQKTISRSEYDNADANYKKALADVDAIRSVIEKKTIRAPFDGRLGIRLVNLGQILNEGEPIVSLQALDPIFVNFQLPQQQLVDVRPGLTVRLTNDTVPTRFIEGTITAINPEVDAATRNVRLQAKVPNAEENLRPGMFVNVSVMLPSERKVIVVPSTAILYAPYSDSVFVVEEKKAEQGGQTVKTVRQQFVRLGEKRGDFIAVTSGLEKGQTVVSTGVFKLRNGQSVVVDNTLNPDFKLAPKPVDA